jgi:poly(beta-D-mannuronate) lyase
VGVSWYAKGDLRPALDSGATTQVAAGGEQLVKAIGMAKPGDKLVLAAGEHLVDRVLVLRAPISISAADPEARPVLTFSRNALFQLEDGSSLKLTNIDIDGSGADDSAGNSLIRTTRYGMLNNYALELDNVHIKNLNINHSFSVLKVAKSTMADHITIKNSLFENITGDILKLDAENDDLGIFNADYVIVEFSEFKAVEGAVAKVYRGGTDESTFGPHVLVKASQFEGVGAGSRNSSGAAFDLEGVQMVSLTGNTFLQSLGLKANSNVGEPTYDFTGNQWGAAKPVVTYKMQPVNVIQE